ncbi:MAG TPA: twin-arginine translocase subunit TatC [Halothiobacillaceae bacterium]|nr:twin-arginine translocase subunit TatC [Halothiobacillaceae bacterium]
MSTKDAKAAADGEQSGLAGFISHLVELRNRLLKAIAVVFVLFLVLFPFRNELFTLLSDPLAAHMPEGASMIAVQVASPFFIPLKLTALTAVFIAIPYLLYQLWAFIAPGLYRHEQQLVVPLLLSSTILFYLGTMFAYFMVFPVVFGFLGGTGPEGVNFAPDINEYLSFATTLFFAFGFVFEVPVATVLLILTGIVTPEQLAEKRRYAILVAFVIGAIFTPPDVISQFMMAIPVWLLYELGIIVGRIMIRRRDAAAELRDNNDALGDDSAGATGLDDNGPDDDGPGGGAATQKTSPGKPKPSTSADSARRADGVESSTLSARSSASGEDIEAEHRPGKQEHDQWREKRRQKADQALAEASDNAPGSPEQSLQGATNQPAKPAGTPLSAADGKSDDGQASRKD